MRTIWVTGVSGSGKSAVSRLLAARGHDAVSTDSAEGLCRWVDAADRPVERPDHPDLAWLDAHRWVWDATTLDELINQRCAGGGRLLWLCGHAANALELAWRFDVTVLLRLDLATMLARLSHPERGNDFGRVGHSRQHLRDNFEVWQRHLESRADVVIDATVDLDTVADHLVWRAGSRVWR